MIAHDAFSSLVNLSDSILVARHLVDEEFLAFLVSFTAVSCCNFFLSPTVTPTEPFYCSRCSLSNPLVVTSNITDAYGNSVITSRHAPLEHHLPPIPHPVAVQLDHPHHLHLRYFFHGLDWQLGLVVK
jgi:hypothetical protein